jgi:hypothetical protein
MGKYEVGERVFQTLDGCERRDMGEITPGVKTLMRHSVSLTASIRAESDMPPVPFIREYRLYDVQHQVHGTTRAIYLEVPVAPVEPKRSYPIDEACLAAAMFAADYEDFALEKAEGRLARVHHCLQVLRKQQPKLVAMSEDKAKRVAKKYREGW